MEICLRERNPIPSELDNQQFKIVWQLTKYNQAVSYKNWVLNQE